MKRGFSLVELSIVLVILGLLVGGVLSGQSLIRAAELRSVSTDFGRYSAAARSFRDKYFAIPGDMTNATSFWGTAAACPGDNTSITAPGVATCNGDGNGQILQAAATANETYRFWQHLANAGMIEGSFTGVPNSATAAAWGNSTSTPNVPKSRIANAMWMVWYIGPIPISSTQFFDGNYDNTFILTASNSAGYTGISLKPEDAWNIDTKIDDGKPGTGMVVTEKNATQASGSAPTSCTDTAYSVAASIASTSNYLFTNTAVVCSLVFKAGF